MHAGLLVLNILKKGNQMQVDTLDSQLKRVLVACVKGMHARQLKRVQGVRSVLLLNALLKNCQVHADVLDDQPKGGQADELNARVQHDPLHSVHG